MSAKFVYARGRELVVLARDARSPPQLGHAGVDVAGLASESPSVLRARPSTSGRPRGAAAERLAGRAGGVA